jgi:hypothetical protein
MKKTTRHILNYSALIAILAAVVIFGCRCATTKQDPLAGWQIAFKEEPDQAITKDFQDFIRKLQSEGKGQAQVTGYYKNGTGQHLVNIEIFEHNQNASWQYALVYDKDDKRIKVTKYGYGRYQS